MDRFGDMCGIAGEVNFRRSPDSSGVKAMTDAIEHRGPDAAGFMSSGPIAFGHRRLSILDPQSRSDQPMSDRTGRFVIVYNGEIYNYADLKHELERRGERFLTTGDTEVLLTAYKVWGAACMDRLNGMFAFAIWDNEKRQLFAARDRFGEKPLYYASPYDGCLIFASELKALRRHPLVNDELDEQSVSRFLSCGYTLGERTILKSVKRLAPASTLNFSEKRAPEISCYWDLASHLRRPSSVKTFEEAQEKLLEILDDAVRIRMVSDVPLGAFLSGGVDSASIVSSMVRFRDANAIKTFTIDFSERSFSEAKEAAEVATFLNVDHHAQTVSPTITDDVSKIIGCSDEPFADTSIVPTYFLAKFARERVTVALSGDGGDELFGGYETYVATRLHRLLRISPSSLVNAGRFAVDRLAPVSWNKVSASYKARQFLKSGELDNKAAHWSWRNIFDLNERAKAAPEIDPTDDGTDEVRRHFKKVNGMSPLQQMAYVDIKTWLCDDILVKVDRATMAHSLESRAPFLDHRLAEFALCLPDHWKLKGLSTKRVLKDALKSRLDPAVMKRSKKGFNAPISHWITSGLKPLYFDSIQSMKARTVIDQGFAEQVYADHIAGRADNGFKLFTLMSLAIWLNGAGQFSEPSPMKETLQ